MELGWFPIVDRMELGTSKQLLARRLAKNMEPRLPIASSAASSAAIQSAARLEPGHATACQQHQSRKLAAKCSAIAVELGKPKSKRMESSA